MDITSSATSIALMTGSIADVRALTIFLVCIKSQSKRCTGACNWWREKNNAFPRTD
jgi:hypothetical protein